MDQKIFRRATYAIFLCGSYPMLIVGCYFGHIPWNMKRLSMDESDLGLSILVFGIFLQTSSFSQTSAEQIIEETTATINAIETLEYFLQNFLLQKQFCNRTFSIFLLQKQFCNRKW